VLVALIAAGHLFAAPAAWAQSRNSDAALEDLIPDSAIADPEAWAGQNTPQLPPPPASGAEPVPPQPAEGGLPSTVPDTTTPLEEGGGFALEWPRAEEPETPAQAALEPEPDLAAGMASLNLPADDGQVAGSVTRISQRVSLVWLQDMANFPDREGFEDRFRDLSTIEQLSRDDAGLAQLAVRARNDNALLARLLRIYGYYDADVTQSIVAAGARDAVDRADAGADAAIRFELLPGDRYHFGAIDLSALSLPTAEMEGLRAHFAIRSGDPISSDRIVAERSKLDVALGESGYAFAKVGDPELVIDHRREQGDLTMPVEPGGRYRFGQVTSNLPKFLSGRHLQTIARFDAGDPYERSEAEDLRRAILATGLVASVAVTPRETRVPQGNEPGEVALDVEMTRAPLRTIAGAVGYESGEGPRAEVSWEHRNLFPPEGLLRLRGIAGLKEQLAGVTVRRNNLGGRDRILTFDLYGNVVERQAYDARTIAFAATYERVTTLLFQKPWTWSAGLEVLASNERESMVRGIDPVRLTYYTAALPLRAAWDGSDDLLDPRKGMRASLRVSPELSRQGGANATYVRMQADASLYQPVSDGVVAAARVRLGSISGAAIGDIAPSRRFYAGGGGSVRGYGYQQIGPRDTAGDPSGGRALTEFSLEARIDTGLMGGALGVVPFVDAGAVDETTTPRLRDIRLGAGIGIRYKTGFGPIRVDVGVPLNRRKGDARLGIYVALGQAF